MSFLFGERISCGRLESGLDEPRTPPHALPGDRPNWPRDRAVDILHVKVEVRLDVEAKKVRGTVTHTVAPLNDGTRFVSFDAVDMTIHGVIVGKREAPFDYDGTRLTVDLGNRRRRGQELQVSISYEAAPRIGMYFIGPDEAYPDKPRQVWTQCQDEDTRYWLPCFDHPSDKFTSDVAVTVPGGWFALSNGRLLQEKANRDGTRTYHWHQDRPHPAYLLTIAAGEFVRVEGSAERVPIDYYVEQKDVEAARRTFGNTPAMMALFEKLTGMPYPWAKYSQVVVRDFVFGGMENTSATTMTENILLDAKASQDFDSDDLVSHELAHQWFGDLLTCRDWSHGWLNEGFATYFEMLWNEHHHGIDGYRQCVIENTRLYLDERYRRPVVTNVYRDPIDIFDRHLYEKGSLVLHMLRAELGDEAFFRSIQRYVREHADQNVITQDLVDAIADETGRNLEWFFDQWVYKPGHPKLKVTWSWDDTTGLASVSVKQTQDLSDGTPVFRFSTTVDFRKGREKPQSFRVEVTRAEEQFVFPLPWKPDLCRFDPYGTVLKELEWEKSPGELRLQLRDDDSVIGRQWAAAELGKKGGAEAVAALEAAVTGDRWWGVQAAAARALGEVRTTAARDALLRCLGVRQPRTRRAVVAALGEFPGDEAVLEALRPLSLRDASWFVEAEACRSIGKLRLPGSFEAIASQFDRPSFRQVVRVGCIDGLVELRDERGFDLLRRAARYGEPFQARPPAVNGLARLGQFFPERKKPLGEELAVFLLDPDFRVRIAAANALKTLGDESQVPALERMAARELDGRGVRTARENALALRKGAATADEVRKLREEFEKLREENSKLRDRVERLEARK